MEVIVRSGQSLPDIALQACGSFEAAMTLARRNDLALTDALAIGQALEAAPEDILSRRVVERYAAGKICPATALTADDLTALRDGIGYMGIEIDFNVN